MAECEKGETDMSENKFIVDKNLHVETKINEPDIAFFDVRKPPFDVYGLYDYKNEPVFKRLPDEVGLNVNEGVSSLYLHTAGGRVRFCTDSKYVAVKCTWEKTTRFSHMPLTGGSAFDMYVDSEKKGTSKFAGTFIPPFDTQDGYESVIKFPDRQKRYITINFPSYNRVTDLCIGVQEGALLESGNKYSFEKPVIFYGSSITQGGCASHPGNTYQAILSRHIDFDYVNLGFSGSGCGEDTIVDYMANMEMSAFFADYDHNASISGLKKTHLKMYIKIREKHPDIPYIMMSRVDADAGANGYGDTRIKRKIIHNTFQYALEAGDENVYFIDGEGIFRGPYEDCCTVDSVHPNDYGFLRMAEAIEGTFIRIINANKMK
jgi:hypothetical protein